MYTYFQCSTNGDLLIHRAKRGPPSPLGKAD